MAHFYTRAINLKRSGGKAEVIDANLRDAAAIAEKIAPYRHARPSAMKLARGSEQPAALRDDATADELRAEIMKRLEILTSAGLIDLQALPVPARGIANQPPPASINRVADGESFIANCADQCHARKCVCVKQCQRRSVPKPMYETVPPRWRTSLHGTEVPQQMDVTGRSLPNRDVRVTSVHPSPAQASAL